MLNYNYFKYIYKMSDKEYNYAEKIQWFKENLFDNDNNQNKYIGRLNDCINDQSFRVIVNLNDLRAIDQNITARLFTIFIIIIYILLYLLYIYIHIYLFLFLTIIFIQLLSSFLIIIHNLKEF